MTKLQVTALMQAAIGLARTPEVCPICDGEGRLTRPNGMVEACTHCRFHELAWAPQRVRGSLRA